MMKNYTKEVVSLLAEWFYIHTLSLHITLMRVYLYLCRLIKILLETKTLAEKLYAVFLRGYVRIV